MTGQAANGSRDPIAVRAGAGSPTRRTRIKAFAVLLATAAAIATAWVIPEFRALQITSWIIYGLLALSLVLVWGRAGIFSFGQSAFFGIGGYVYGIVAINWIEATGESLSAIVVAVLVAGVAALVLGYFMFYGKVGDVYVGIITLATTLVLLTFLSSTAGPQYHVGNALLGGYNGMTGIPPLSYVLPWIPSQALSIPQSLAFCAIVAASVAFGVRALLQGPFGRILTGLRENELRTQLLGYDIRYHKLVVFALGGAIAGLAGALFAAWALFINPVVFGLQQAALVVIWVLVGGRASLVGAFAGVVLVDGLASFLGGSGGGATPIILGAVLIAVVLFLPGGLVPAFDSLIRRCIPKAQSSRAQIHAPVSGSEIFRAAESDDTQRGGVLEVFGLSKNFGGLSAVANVSLAFAERGVHCLIGPNGAGKSTFFNLLIGRYLPSAGRVMFAGRAITRAEPYERVRLGLGIKLQVASIYPGLSAAENVWLAAYAKLRDVELAERHAANVLHWLGLHERSDDAAGALAHGQQQWLEIGMVLAAHPAIILLDEPTSGMTRDETARTADLIKELGRHASVIVVEHDMEFVRQLGVAVSVFHQGGLFAQGSLDELRRDERILDIYLGRGRKIDA
jgi:branched-chain amino acid transport system permease protein